MMKIEAKKDLFKRGHTDIVIRVSESKNNFDLVLKSNTARRLALDILEALK
jgi:hypothetical protein